jgi:hypothetical protein
VMRSRMINLRFLRQAAFCLLIGGFCTHSGASYKCPEMHEELYE